MQMFPPERQRSDNVTTRRDYGAQRFSRTESPIDSPMKRITKLKVLIIHHAPLIPLRARCIDWSDSSLCSCDETDDAPTGREMLSNVGRGCVSTWVDTSSRNRLRADQGFSETEPGSDFLSSRHAKIRCRSNGRSALERMDT